jgi:hypothetical protein
VLLASRSYRNWGSIQWTHLIILGSVMTAMVSSSTRATRVTLKETLLFLLGLQVMTVSVLFSHRLAKYNQDRKKMNRRTQVPITQRDLGRVRSWLVFCWFFICID